VAGSNPVIPIKNKAAHGGFVFNRVCLWKLFYRPLARTMQSLRGNARSDAPGKSGLLKGIILPPAHAGYAIPSGQKRSDAPDRSGLFRERHGND
ncbi:MAG: hypothetical protein II814_08790, partial [Treponema sp.]|nr:hypothetical protein [Treponema sp.]